VACAKAEVAVNATTALKSSSFFMSISSSSPALFQRQQLPCVPGKSELVHRRFAEKRGKLRTGHCCIAKQSRVRKVAMPTDGSVALPFERLL